VEAHFEELAGTWEDRYQKEYGYWRPYDRRLLVKLSQCAWRVLSVYLKQGISLDDPNPGAIIAVQTFGDFLNFNPHLHIIATDGCFDQDGGFMAWAVPDASVLEGLFRLEVLGMLKKEGKITDFIIENMMGWYHSGFNVYYGEAIWPSDQEGIERLAQYIVRAPISQERLLYIPASESHDGVARVIYKGKNSGVRETFVALDWLARLVTHIPNRGEQLVRYYGYYSNKSRGMRKKTETDNQAPLLVDSDISKKALRRNWARLIQKVYHTDPLLCRKCKGSMRIISFIEDEETIKKILLHLDLWMPGNHDPPNLYKEHQYIPASKSSGPSDDITHDDYVLQMPYEDEYSHLTPYEDFLIKIGSHRTVYGYEDCSRVVT
jgi:hypothetical protein